MATLNQTLKALSRTALGRICVLFAGSLLATHALAQSQTQPTAELLASWVALDAPPGHEHHATEQLQKQFPGWQKTRAGNLIKVVGQGDHTSLVACLLDAPAFAISQITQEGYLRLHQAGATPEHPLWSQAHEGQQLRILTRQGPVVGVTALANGHFSNLHAQEVALTQPQDLWLDVGASSSADVAALGIELLDPVSRHLPAWSFHDWAAGPAVGSRVGCATAVAAAEAGISGAGRTIYVLSTLSRFGYQGFSAALAQHGPIDRIVLLESGVEDAQSLPALPRGFQSFSPASINPVTRLAPRVTDAGSLMERIHRDEAASLGQKLLAALDAKPQSLAWSPVKAPAAPLNDQFTATGRHPQAARINAYLDRLAELGTLYGVSKSEGPIRAAVRKALPIWAQNALQSDKIGNLWLDLGPANLPATVFMAHMDEVGWKVADISKDGVVDLIRQGGALSLAGEGQPAVLHIDEGAEATSNVSPRQLRGVFLSRKQPQSRQPEILQAWFGYDRRELEALGVSEGMPVTGYKEGHRLANNRFTVRSMDDRVGTAALIEAVRRLTPEALTQRVVIVWSVQEEGGLHGAKAMASALAQNAKRIYSIDTFVTSDTPLEQPHFAYAQLGRGPVLRSMESSSMVVRAELDRNRAIANASGVEYQIGMTQGGTDGTTFTFYGVPNAGLSWPGRYSHGPAELGDGYDMVRLVDLIGSFIHAEP